LLTSVRCSKTAHNANIIINLSFFFIVMYARGVLMSLVGIFYIEVVTNCSFDAKKDPQVPQDPKNVTKNSKSTVGTLLSN
jgi:hypothetical protein